MASRARRARALGAMLGARQHVIGLFLSQRTRNAIITSLLNLTLFRRKWHYLRRVSAEMLLINTYWYEKPRANIPSKGISITELWIPIINSWIHIIHDNREYPQFSYGYSYNSITWISIIINYDCLWFSYNKIMDTHNYLCIFISVLWIILIAKYGYP